MSQGQHIYINKSWSSWFSRCLEPECTHAKWIEWRESNFLWERVKKEETKHQFQLAPMACRQFVWSVQQTATCKPKVQHRGRWYSLHEQLTACQICCGGFDWTSTNLMQKPRWSYLDNVMCVLFSPAPASQRHPSVQWGKAGAGLSAKQVIVWVEMMGDSQAQLSWDKAVQIPVNCHAVNVLSCMNITQDLEQQGGE